MHENGRGGVKNGVSATVFVQGVFVNNYANSNFSRILSSNGRNGSKSFDSLMRYIFRPTTEPPPYNFLTIVNPSLTGTMTFSTDGSFCTMSLRAMMPAV